MWQEKIDLLQKNFTPKEFHVLFTDGANILKRIERRFIVKQDATYILTNWADNMKNRRFVHEIAATNFPGIFNLLKHNQAYWFVALIGSGPTSRQYVYSGVPKALQSLASLTSNDFFIVDKQLCWFLYFRRSGDKIEVYKSGEAKTPLDTERLN